ncbi:MAG: ribulose-phosphate 3-epimerase [Anaerotruncus sp.]|nr:ribulose-phosphate 3-epimerase [Anaerotruncus sp.]
MSRKIQIAPSLLSCDFARLGAEVAAMQQAGAELIHFDVMDGHFVPNLSIGLPVLASLRRATDAVLDVHLMVSDPLTYAPQFADKGADIIVFHVESDSPVQAVIDVIKAKGKRVGLALKPATPAQAAFPYLEQLDMVLAMTVEPGFGGQRFMADICPKVAALRAECDRLGLKMDIEVDGGIDNDTIGQAAQAGANVFVAGSALFGKPDYTQAVAMLRKNALTDTVAV